MSRHVDGERDDQQHRERTAQSGQHTEDQGKGPGSAPDRQHHRQGQHQHERFAVPEHERPRCGEDGEQPDRPTGQRLVVEFVDHAPSDEEETDEGAHVGDDDQRQPDPPTDGPCQPARHHVKEREESEPVTGHVGVPVSGQTEVPTGVVGQQSFAQMDEVRGRLETRADSLCGGEPERDDDPGGDPRRDRIAPHQPRHPACPGGDHGREPWNSIRLAFS